MLLTDVDNHSCIRLCCDSLATVQTLTTGRARDPVLAAIARAVWFIQATRDIHLIVVHISGKDMTIPDSLSRAHLSIAHRQFADNIIHDLNITRVHPPKHVLNFSNYM